MKIIWDLVLVIWDLSLLILSISTSRRPVLKSLSLSVILRVNQRLIVLLILCVLCDPVSLWLIFFIRANPCRSAAERQLIVQFFPKGQAVHAENT